VTRSTSKISRAALACAAALAPCLAGAATEAGGTTGTTSPTPAPNAALSKAMKCQQLKKRIADYEAAKAAAPKGAKIPGSETIKADIYWTMNNCK
jgi:hypothetical protein